MPPFLLRTGFLLAVLWLALWPALGPATVQAASPSLPPVGHVFVIMLENKTYSETFGPASPAPYLSRELPAKGALLSRFYGVAHFSLPNYIALISGQAPNPDTQDDCETYTDFVTTGLGADGQVIGRGCVYPASVPTLADQLSAAGRSWKAYLEDMGNDPARESPRCGHPPLGAADRTQVAAPNDQYAARHNPFVYFHSIIDGPDCAARVVALPALSDDLRSAATTPEFVYIAPNLCHDGHDGGRPGVLCANGEPGGLASADAFLRLWVPRILAAPAFQKDGLLVITFDEADVPEIGDPGADASACCGELPGPNVQPGQMIGGVASRGPGIAGPGGGRIGAVVLSPFVRPGTRSSQPYNHYSLLRTIEDLFGLGYLGYAGRPDLRPFGSDLFRSSGR
ncbi:MAG: phosphoesterase [Telmatospirillum sp.]|nr:phosphoesterase [Telmatospirillum sp.]